MNFSKPRLTSEELEISVSLLYSTFSIDLLYAQLRGFVYKYLLYNSFSLLYTCRYNASDLRTSELVVIEKHSINTDIEVFTCLLPVMTDRNLLHCDLSYLQSGSKFPYLNSVCVNTAVSYGSDISVV